MVGRDGQGLGRRHVLQLTGGAVVAGLLAACSSGGGDGSTAAPFPATTATTGTQPDMVAGTLPIPSLLVPDVQGGTKVFRLTAQQGESQFIPDQATTTYGFNGSYL